MWRRKLILLAGILTLLATMILLSPWNRMRWRMHMDILQELAPIDFYGAVVDEQGNALQGAEVRLRVRKPNRGFILDPENTLIYREYTRTSDAAGRFELKGESGIAVDVMDLRLKGYRFKPRIIHGGNWATSFYYAGPGANPPHVPNPNNPVTFEMEPLKPERPGGDDGADPPPPGPQYGITTDSI